MNKTIKILIIIVLSLLALAIIVGGALFFGHMVGRGIFGAVKDPAVTADTEIELGSFSQDFGDSVKALDIRVEAGNYEIVEGERFTVTGEDINAKSFSCQLEGDTLVIRETWKNRFSGLLQSLFQNRGYYPKVTVTVPAGVQLRDVELTVSAGKLDVCDLNMEGASVRMMAGELHAGKLQAGRMDVDLSAGGAVFDAITADTASVEVSAGGVEIRAMEADSLELDTSAGSIKIEDLRFAQLEADCSAGSIQLETLEKENDCRMEMDISAGSVRVNGKNYKGDTVLGDKDASRRMELNVSAGQIQVDFQ